MPRVSARCTLVALATVAAFLLASCGSAAAPPGRDDPGVASHATNPVLAGDHPDPSIAATPDGWWMATTGPPDGPPFPLFRSADLVHWHAAGTVLRRRPPWSAGVYWAPQILARDGRYLAYYSARRRGAKPCVAVAIAPAPGGPYRDRGPIVCQPSGSIDPAAAVDEHGHLVLLWKQMGFGGPLWTQRLDRSGTRVTGSARVALRPDAAWEGRVTEGPSILRRGAWFYLFYSGGLCCSHPCTYAMGVARSRSLAGPYAPAPGGPILSSGARWTCPGGGSVVRLGSGRAVLVFQAYARGDPRRAREVLLARLRFGAGGWPAVHGGVPPERVRLRP
jgi:xylan 1,4-beta-xylosidase